ncbi:MAG: hypothetical protein AB4080_24965 [Trichodesmium sp.]
MLPYYYEYIFEQDFQKFTYKTKSLFAIRFKPSLKIEKYPPVNIKYFNFKALNQIYLVTDKEIRFLNQEGQSLVKPLLLKF